MEGLRVANSMVCRADEDLRAGLSLASLQGGQGHRGCGVTATGFKQDIRIYVDVIQLFGHQEAVLLIAHHDRAHSAQIGGQAQQGVLQHAVVTVEAQQLLGVMGPRERPQPGTIATGNNHRNQHRSIPSKSPHVHQGVARNQAVQACVIKNAPLGETGKEVMGRFYENPLLWVIW